MPFVLKITLVTIGRPQPLGQVTGFLGLFAVTHVGHCQVSQFQCIAHEQLKNNTHVVDRAGLAMGRRLWHQVMATWKSGNRISWKLRHCLLGHRCGPPLIHLLGCSILTKKGEGLNVLFLRLTLTQCCALWQDRRCPLPWTGLDQKPSCPTVSLVSLHPPAVKYVPLLFSHPHEGMNQHWTWGNWHRILFQSSRDLSREPRRGRRNLPLQAGNSQMAKKEEEQEMSFQSPSLRRRTQSSPEPWLLGSFFFQLL